MITLLRVEGLDPRRPRLGMPDYMETSASFEFRMSTGPQFRVGVIGLRV